MIAPSASPCGVPDAERNGTHPPRSVAPVVIRLAIGLESPANLVADLDAALSTAYGQG